MKFYIKVFSLLLIATLVFMLSWKGCNFVGGIMGDQATATTINLKGSNWTSEFYHYKNNYFFQTDSTGYSEDGQFCRSTPIDTALYHNSRDSIAYAGPDPFKYSFKDSLLILTYAPMDTSNQRIFRLWKDKAGISFISEYEYTYGHEALERKKK